MSCPHIAVQGISAFYTERLKRKIFAERVPVIGSMELTNRCNFRCAHCWISSPECLPDPLPELTTGECLEILDQLVEAGCLWLLLTGGEPLLRPDFFEIYTAAKARGFLVSFFTNGTLVTPSLVDRLRDLPPHWVEITLYGATEETYARMTGVSGGLERCLRGVELLLDRGIKLKLKSVVHRLNVAEVDELRKIAQGYGVEFRHDALLNCGVQGERHPLQYRLEPEQVVALDLSDERYVSGTESFIEQFGHLASSTETVFDCGAGVNTVHIDCHGQMTPCMTLRHPAIDIRGGRLAAVWETDVKELLRRPWTTSSRCRTCKLLWLCESCPAWAWLEHGDFETPVDFLCRIAHLVSDEFGLMDGGEDGDHEQREPRRRQTAL